MLPVNHGIAPQLQIQSSHYKVSLTSADDVLNKHYS